MAKNKLQSATDQRKFVMIYNDFLESNLLNDREKLLFITLKKYADDKGKCFPSLNTLSRITGNTKKRVIALLKQLEEKNVLIIEKRKSNKKGNESNLYTLYDYADIWKAGSSEEVTDVIEKIDIQKAAELLQRNGFIVTKEKEPVSEPTKAHAQALEYNHFYTTDNTVPEPKSQDIMERYSVDQVKQYFDYSIMVHDNPYQQQDIDSVINILHSILNTNKQSIRIGGEEKPCMVVQAKLMKLTYSSIMYAIDKFKEQTERIKNPKAYLLTILYGAEEQMHLDISNQVNHDMYGDKETKE